MGGGSSGSSSVTTPVSSGTYGPFTFSDQTTMTPNSGMNWGSAIGGGLSSAGKGVSGAQSAIPQTTMPQFGGATNYGDQQMSPATIPQNNMLDVLLRLLSGQ